MNATNNIAEDLFNKIRSRFQGLKLGEESGEITIEPEQARFFDFNYMDGENPIGHISISIAEEGSMKVYFSANITEDMNNTQQKRWYNFLRELRQFAKKRLLSFDVRDITKDSLDKRDYEFLKKHSTAPLGEPNTVPVEESIMNESNLFGTKTQSFQKLLDTKLIIKHSKKIPEEQFENSNARTRNISSLFIENQEGERFKYPFVHLAGARAMQRHVANGGNPYDSIGESIVGMSQEISQLKGFSNYVTRNNLVNENTSNIVEKASERLNGLKEQLKKMSKQKAYESYVETFEESQNIELPETVRQDLKSMFTVISFKEEMENVFPVLYKLMKEDDLGYEDIVSMTTQESEKPEHKTKTVEPFEDFEHWAIALGEESAIASRNAEEKQIALRELNNLVGKDFPAGVNGTNGIQSLEGIIDDPALYAEIKTIAKEDPDQNISPLIKQWLEENVPDVVDEIDFKDIDEASDDEPPFEPDDETTDKDEFGNPIKKKNVAKHLAKKGMKKAMDKDTIKEVADFVMSHYDRDQGTFPKGPTAVAQSVEKKFGEMAGAAAQKMVERMAPQQDADIVSEEDLDEATRREFMDLLAKAGIGAAAAGIGGGIGAMKAGELADKMTGGGASKDDESGIDIKPRQYPDPKIVDLLVKFVNENGYDRLDAKMQEIEMFKNDPKKFQDYKDAVDKELGKDETVADLKKLAGLRKNA